MIAALENGQGADAVPRCEEWLLPDGRRVVVRSVTPEDAELAQAFVRGLSDEARYFRFHGAFTEMPKSLLERLMRVDHLRHVALIVVAVENGRRVQIAEGRFAPGDAPGVAEFALVVGDRWQGFGIGRRLIRRLEGMAHDAGYFSFGGDVLRENRPMLRLARRSGFEVAEYAGDAGLMRVEKVLDRAAAVIPARRRAAGDTVLTYGESRS